ncbi:hypothetical protein WA158_005600 [Blastocystis sp. Blastoise]
MVPVAYTKPTGKPLPKHEENMFNQAVKCYEDSEYKKGLKIVDQILKTCPDSGKTWSLKGIMIFSNKNNEKEGEPLLKKGIELDPSSHIVWHVYGIFHKTMKRWAEAKIAYTKALALDPENVQILIDLSSIQLQTRDYAGFRKSKASLLQLRPSQSQFWMGLVYGCYMTKDYDNAISILNSFLDTLEKDRKPNFIDQEMILFKAIIYKTNKQYQLALDTLSGYPDILDDSIAQEMEAELYLLTNQLDKANNTFMELLNSNAENYKFYRGLECCLLQMPDLYTSESRQELPSTTLTLTEQQRSSLISMYLSLISRLPRAHAPKTILLYIYTDDAFINHIQPILRKAVRKGIPSFLNSIKPLLLKDNKKLLAIESLLLSFVDSLKQTNTLPLFEGDAPRGNNDILEEEPMTLFWTYYLLVQIYDIKHLYDECDKYIALALAHSPTSSDVFILQSKIAKHRGDVAGCVRGMNEASSIDLADRYMNTLYCKALLRANNIDKADEVLSYWTKDKIPLRIDLTLLQVNWYEIEMGDAYYRLHNIPMALKMYGNILTHFQTFVDDQFDFLGYVFRKGTWRSFLNLVESVDNIYHHKYFTRAAVGAINCYLELDKHPIPKPAKEEVFVPEPHKSTIDYEDDMDPKGIKKSTTGTPLQDALPTALLLLTHPHGNMEILDKVFSLFVAKKDYGNMLKTLVAMSDVDVHSPYLYNAIYTIQQLYDTMGKAKILFERKIQSILSTQSLDEYANTSYSTVTPTLENICQMAIYCQHSNPEKIISLFDSLSSIPVPKIKALYISIELLKEHGISEEQYKPLVIYAKEKYTDFETYSSCYHQVN